MALHLKITLPYNILKWLLKNLVKARHKEPFCSQKCLHLYYWESRTYILYLLCSVPLISIWRDCHMSLYSAPHMCIWCMLNINALGRILFSSSFVSENVVKKMCNVPLQNETFRKWNFLDNKPHILYTVSACGRSGSSDCLLLVWSSCGCWADLCPLFNWSQVQSCIAELRDCLSRCWFSLHSGPSQGSPVCAAVTSNSKLLGEKTLCIFIFYSWNRK